MPLMLGAAFFWLETLWWGAILLLGIGATISALSKARRTRRRPTPLETVIEERARAWRNRVRDDEIAELRAEDRTR